MYHKKQYEKLQKYRYNDFESQSNSNEWKTMLESIGNVRIYVCAAFLNQCTLLIEY